MRMSQNRPPAPGELLIKVEAASVNPIDWKIRAGYTQQIFPRTLPFIPGGDASGYKDFAPTEHVTQD
jgi:NADPH:quinone reductase-like Zn-dependent oxidoreductase